MFGLSFGRLLGRAAIAVMTGFLMFLGTGAQSLAAQVPVCSMSREEFVGAAFPDNDTTRLQGGKLLKYATPPGLVVLAPENRLALGKQVGSVFKQIAEDDVIKTFHPSFVAYSSFAEAEQAIGQLGNDNIFVVIAAEPEEPAEASRFRSMLQRILHWSERVEKLIARSKASSGFSSSNRIELTTGEVISAAVIINPKYDDIQIGLMIYLAYYFELAPGASSEGQSYFTRFFGGVPHKSITLTDFARKFFRVFADDHVKFGMTKDSFVECS
jgi:hypothetical protein